MREKMEAVLREGLDAIAAVKSEQELQEVKAAYLGKQGTLTAFMKEVPKLPVEERPEMGKAVNAVKVQLSDAVEARRTELKLQVSQIPADFDYTIPGELPPEGALHPITQMCYDLNDAFRSMGFEIFQGNDVTSEFSAFDTLNFPPAHPARESMDTYWLEGHDKGEANEKLCLRPHLTGGSVRYLQTHKAPYRFVYPGHVYRNVYHHQSYYPQWIDADSLTFEGALLADNYVDESGMGNYYVQYAYAWGYADNQGSDSDTGSAGEAVRNYFKISSAVAADGSAVDLQYIDFVKVQSAINFVAGALGEISTEVLAIRDENM